MRAFMIIAVFLLSACAAKPKVTQRFDDWTGFTEIITAEHETLRDRTAIMTVRGIMIERNGQRRFGVLTSLRRLGRNRPIIMHISSGDTRLDYRRHDRLLTQCADRCRRTETGVIIMSEQAFRTASRTGLPLRVQGRRGRYETHVPAGLFQQALSALSSGGVASTE